MACNLRFNPKNARHVEAAKTLSMIDSKYKTAFVTMAIEAYREQHPDGIDTTELYMVKTLPNRCKHIPSSNAAPEAAVPASGKETTQAGNEAAEAALDFYEIT